MPSKPKLLPEEREAIIGKPFYSALDRAAGALKRKVGTGAEFMKELQGMGGIKQAEIEDRRLGDLMNAPKMTHDEMLHELQAHQTPQIQERILKNNELDEDEVYDLANRLYHDASERGIWRGLSWDRWLEHAREIIHDQNDAHNLDAAQFEKYTLPGGHNYREMLLHLPIDRMHPENNFKSSHFGVPNILAHMRLKDRRGPNGEKLLHLEELQSDWHQQGREKGYQRKDLSPEEIELKYIPSTVPEGHNPSNYPGYYEAFDKNTGDFVGRHSGTLTPEQAMRDAVSSANQFKTGVPDAPFKKNWEEMALKRLIHHAAENNYDGIVVTPGAEQAERYSLAKHIDDLHYSGSNLVAYDGEGNEVIKRTGVTPQELPSLVGKELADKLMAQEPRGTLRSLRGVDMEVGGEGMKGFYDKKVPNILNGIGKKYGVKTELNAQPIETEPANRLQVGEMTYGDPAKFSQVHHFPITEEMKKDVLANGLPMYRDGGVIHKAEGGNVQPLIASPKQPSVEQMQKELASKEDALRLYHGSPEENLSQVQDKGLFGGVFGHVNKNVALSHGDHIYHSDIPESKILTNDDLNYNLPYKKVSKALINNLPHLARNKDLREKAWEAIVEDKGVLHLDEDDLQKIFGTSDLGEAGWEAQKVRGAIAKYLGYQAVQMEDEHGTSYLILPGAKLHKSSKEIEKYAEGGIVHKAAGGLLKTRRSNDPTESMSRRGERTVNEGGTHIMKEENGNWLNDPSMFTRVKRTLHPELNQWVDRNLANYVKKQMGTANDPVRLLAEQGITHLPQETIDNAPEDFLGYSFEKDRAKEGYPEKGLGQSDAAKAWELMSDSSIIPVTAGSLLHKAKKYQDYMDAKEAFDKHASTLNDRLEANLRGRGFEEGDIKAILKGNDSLKASTLNDEEYNRLKNKYDNLAGFHSGHSWDLLNRNLWLKKLDPNEKIYKPNNINQLHFDHIYDVLNEDLNSGRLRPEQLNKVSIEHAIRRTHEYDQEKARRMAEAQLKSTEGMPVVKEYPSGHKWIELTSPKTVPNDYALPEGMKLDTIDHPRYGLLHTVSDSKGITQIRATDSPEKALLRFYNRRDGEGYKTLADALKYEGDTMGHCVGGYTPDVVAGKSRIFSLRDAKNEPHVTVEVIPSKTLTPEQRESQMGFFVQRLLGEGMSEEQAITQANKLYPESETLSAIKQIKGKGNAKPKKDYIPYVQDFVKSGNWSHVDDLHNTDLQHSDKMPERKTFEEAGMQVPKYFSENDRDNLIHEYHNRTSSPVDPDFMAKTYGIPKKAEGGVIHKADGGSIRETHNALLRHLGTPEHRQHMRNLKYLQELMAHMADGGRAKPAGIQEELERLKAKMLQETALYNQYVKEHQKTSTNDLPTYASWKEKLQSNGINKLKDGGQLKRKKKAEKETPDKRILIPAIGSGGVKGIVVPRHMLEGTSGTFQKGSRAGQEFKNLGMNDINIARAEVYGPENRDPLTVGDVGRIHKDVLAQHFAKPIEQQVAEENDALRRLRAAKHIGNDANTLDASEKLDTVNHETDDQGRNYVGWASKGVAGHALYTSGHGENAVRHVINTCPGQTEGCGGGVDENGVVDTKRGTCFAPNAESQYVNASVRRAAHEQAKHDPAMTVDWILAHTGSLREAARLADRNNKVTLFRPNVVDETDVSSRHVIRGLNKQRKELGLPMMIANSYGKTNELHDPENGYFVTHSNVGPKVKQGQSIKENIGRDKQRVRSTILAAEANGRNFINDDGHLTPPKNSYMVTDVKRNSPLSKAMEQVITHAKYWDSGTPINKLKEEQLAEGNEAHYDGEGKLTTPDKAHYGHVTVNGKRYEYQKQHILHPRLVQVGKNEDGSPHMIPTDSRFKDEEFLPQQRFMTKNGKQAGAILMTTPTESTSNAGHQTSFTHHINEHHLEHAKHTAGEYEIDNPLLQEEAAHKEYVAPKPIKFFADGGTVKSIPSPYHEEEDLHESFKAFPEQFSEAQVHLHTRNHEHQKHKKHKG